MPWAAATGSECGTQGPTGWVILVISRKVSGGPQPTSLISARLDRNQLDSSAATASRNADSTARSALSTVILRGSMLDRREDGSLLGGARLRLGRDDPGERLPSQLASIWRILLWPVAGAAFLFVFAVGGESSAAMACNAASMHCASEFREAR
jgi:hypothetical protein